MSTYYQRVHGVPHGGEPPNPPELPAGADPEPRWPAWYAPVGFLVGFTVTVFVSAVVGVFAVAFGADVEDGLAPGLVLALTLLQSLILCATAVFLAARTRRPQPWHFGLRRGRFWPSVGWAALGFATFMAAAAAYSALVAPEGEQSVTDDLGADESALAYVAAGILVIVVAPIAEEFFYRGFFYRAIRSRLGVLAAAAVDAVVFGLIHFTGSDTLELIPMLALLGFVFCLVYERTKTLYSVIGLHALNNTIAYWAATDDPSASLVFGPLMLALCLAGPRFLHEPRPAAA